MIVSILMALATHAIHLDQQAGPARSTMAAELQPLARLVGHCWRATFPGSASTDTHCYSLMPGGRQIRDRHVVRGAPSPYAGETIFRWDPEARSIRYDYFASDGGYSGGHVSPIAGGLSFSESYVGARGQSMTLRNGLTWESDGSYWAESERRDGDEWRRMWRMRFERVAEAPAEQAP